MASCENGIIARDGENVNRKDEFADYLVQRLGISPETSLDILFGDITAHIRL